MRIAQGVAFFCLLFATVTLGMAQEETSSRVTLEDRLAEAKKKLANTWYADPEATTLYVKKRFAGEEDAVDQNNMLKQFATVAVRFTLEGEMKILSRRDLTLELHQATFVCTIDDKGDVYLLGQGEGMSSVLCVSFENDQLVLSRNRTPKPSECTVLVKRE